MGRKKFSPGRPRLQEKLTERCPPEEVKLRLPSSPRCHAATNSVREAITNCVLVLDVMVISVDNTGVFNM